METEPEPQNPKNPSDESPARARRPKSATSLIKKAAKKLEKLAAELTDQDAALAIATLRSQLTAVKKIWDIDAKCLINIPDEKIRFDAAVMILAYKWGRPVERSIGMTADADDFPALVAALSASPTFQDKISQQKALEGEQSTPVFLEGQ